MDQQQGSITHFKKMQAIATKELIYVRRRHEEASKKG